MRKGDILTPHDIAGWEHQLLGRRVRCSVVSATPDCAGEVCGRVMAVERNPNKEGELQLFVASIEKPKETQVICSTGDNRWYVGRAENSADVIEIL